MGDKVDVDPDVLHQHATEVRNVMKQIESATLSASNPLDFKAFGLACIAPAQILDGWIAAALALNSAAVLAGYNVAKKVDDMANAYREQDDLASTSFGKCTPNVTIPQVNGGGEGN